VPAQSISKADAQLKNGRKGEVMLVRNQISGEQFNILTDRSARGPTPELKAVHAKIGRQALEIDFLAGALGHGNDAYARR
jgi:hypothetical protein